MSTEHKRPLYAFVAVSMLAAFLMVGSVMRAENGSFFRASIPISDRPVAAPAPVLPAEPTQPEETPFVLPEALESSIIGAGASTSSYAPAAQLQLAETDDDSTSGTQENGPKKDGSKKDKTGTEKSPGPGTQAADTGPNKPGKGKAKGHSPDKAAKKAARTAERDARKAARDARKADRDTRKAARDARKAARDARKARRAEARAARTARKWMKKLVRQSLRSRR